jgi:hypothetical protein
MGLEENKYNHLEELGGSNYEIADGQPNIKGWAVKIDEEVRIGEVEELLFDPETNSVRYLVVDLEEEETPLAERKVLIPIGVAQLFEDSDLVLLPNISLQQLGALPAYERGGVSPAVELMIRTIFVGTNTEGLVSDDVYEREGFYRHNHFNEDNFYKHTKTPLMEGDPGYGEGVDYEGEAARSVSRIAQRPASPVNPFKELEDEDQEPGKQGSEPTHFTGGNPSDTRL